MWLSNGNQHGQTKQHNYLLIIITLSRLGSESIAGTMGALDGMAVHCRQHAQTFTHELGAHELCLCCETKVFTKVLVDPVFFKYNRMPT